MKNFQAHRMTRLEWVYMLMRGPDYDGAWINYLKAGWHDSI